ncbi:MAG: CpaF family protein [Pelotomaculum sp.]|nr:CpaF family protein [Pelotomaculum sp.]
MDDIMTRLSSLDEDYRMMQEMVIINDGTVFSKGVIGSEDRQKILTELRLRTDKLFTDDLLKKMDTIEGRTKIKEIIEEEVRDITRDFPNTVAGAVEEIIEEEYKNVTGFGLVQELLDREGIEEFWINGTDIWYSPSGTEEKFKWEKSFSSKKEVYRLIDRVLAPLGKRANEVNTIVDAWLPDRTRVTINMDPTAIYGPAVAFRKHPKLRLTFDDLVRNSTVLPKTKELILKAIEARFNTAFTGGTKTGKTTVMNAAICLCPPKLRYIVVEDRHELELPRDFFAVYFITRDPGPDGRGWITYRMLVKNALSISPDSIIMGEARDEAFADIVDACNTGHDLTFFTLHTGDYLGDDAAEGEGTVTRMLALMDRAKIPENAARRLVSSGIQLDIHVKRFKGRGRKVSRISGIFGMRGDNVWVEDIIRYDPGSDREIVVPTGAGMMAKLLKKRHVEPPEWMGGGSH